MAEEIPVKPKIRWRDSLRRDFLAGMLVFLPVAITLWFIGWMIDLLDSVLAVMPDAFHPNFYLPFAIPKLGALVTVLLILFLGILTRGVATRRFLAAWESVLGADSDISRYLQRGAKTRANVFRSISS